MHYTFHDPISHCPTPLVYLHRYTMGCPPERGDDPRALASELSYGCPPERGDDPRALASELSYVHVDKHSITILYHLYQCIPCTITKYLVLKLVIICKLETVDIKCVNVRKM